MEISEIKQRLDIVEVAATFNIAVGKDGKALCPFHDDTSPSLQFSQQKQICTCFSSNCAVGTMDVIGLTEQYLQVTKHEALLYLTKLAGGDNQEEKADKASKKPEKPIIHDYAKDFEGMKTSFVSSSTARKYAESRKLNRSLLQLGYNAYKSSRFDYLRGCLTFGLRDASGKVVSIYGRSIKGEKGSTHFYTSDRKGLFPSYPRARTKKLILTESVIDAASLLSILNVTKEYEILALYGTNGFTEEHAAALKDLKSLEEIILFFDGDEAGIAALEKLSDQIHQLLPGLKISEVVTPEGEDINSLWVNHDSTLFLELLQNRRYFLFSEEKITEESKALSSKSEDDTLYYLLDTSNPNHLKMSSPHAHYAIKGGLRKDLDSLKVTLVIEHPESLRKSRNKLDLYEDRLISKVCRDAAEKLMLRADLLELDVNRLTDLVEAHREQQQTHYPEDQVTKVQVPSNSKRECIEFLAKENLLDRINELIGESGVVGEEENRIFLFGIASSYKMQDTLHALIQGSSGSGKTHLLASMLSFMPPEDVISLTRVTESSFYNYGSYDLSHKIIGLEDYDGLEEKAELAFRELQSKGMISSSTTVKDEATGNIGAKVKTVHGPIASLAATTKGEIYEDNMSRCFLIAVDESEAQTFRIIKHQNQLSAGKIERSRNKEITLFLQNCVRLLESHEVINPYADQLELPKEAHKIRRLNSLFQSYVRQITLINQYQRKKDARGRLISEKQDIEITIKMMFESILLKVDELDGSLRGFYERLKEYVREKGETYEFIQREIRQKLKVSKTQLHRYLTQLMDLEYLQKVGFGSHGAVRYKIIYWDDNAAFRHRVRKHLTSQLEQI